MEPRFCHPSAKLCVVFSVHCPHLHLVYSSHAHLAFSSISYARVVVNMEYNWAEQCCTAFLTMFPPVSDCMFPSDNGLNGFRITCFSLTGS